MLRIFDYLFYRFTRFYIKNTDGRNPYILSVCILSLLYSLNLLSLLFLIFNLFKIKSDISLLIMLLLWSIAFALHVYRYYSRVSYDMLYERWKNESAKTQIRKNVVIICYFIFTFIFAISVAINAHSHH